MKAWSVIVPTWFHLRAMLVLGVHALGPICFLQAADYQKPNFVIVFCDDLGYADISCYGAKNISTPNIDRLAAEGMRFSDFYVAQAVCSASRAALLTGCYPNRIGILGA